jgi:hypothetical protein
LGSARREIVVARTLQPGLLAALLFAGALAHAQQSLVPTRSLAFGSFVAGTGGTVTVSPSGARSRSGGVALLSSPASAASFTFSDTDPAKANSACIISLPPDGSVALTGDSGSMPLTGFTSNPSNTAVMSGGTLQFSVGATLNVGAHQPSGNYSGTVPITVEYQ